MRPILESLVAVPVISKLQTANKVVGVKQTRKAVARSQAQLVFLASDADPAVTGPIQMMCRERMIPVCRVSHMRDLGVACGIALDCAAAAVLAE